MATVKQRLFAGFGAGLFLITSSALTVIVIYTLVQQNNDKKETAKASNAIAASTKVTTQAGEKMQNFTPTQTPQTQLQVIDNVVGTGAEVKATDTISADYVGALMNTGVIFDASSNHGGPQTFPLSGVIKGWSLGLVGMKVGGTRRLLIPASLAYGAGSTAGIPANSDLVFDVTLTKIN